MDNPVHDIVCSLMEVPFYRHKKNDQKDILLQDRPTPPLSVLRSDKRQGQTFSRSFKVHWYVNHQWESL